MKRKLKIMVSVTLQYIVLSPLIPPMLLQMGLRSAADGIDWLFQGSWLVAKLVNASDRIEEWSWR